MIDCGAAGRSSLDRNRKRHTFGIGAIHMPARTAGEFPVVSAFSAIERDGRLDPGRWARFGDLKPDLAGFFLRTVHAAQTDMLPDQGPGKLIAADRTFFRDGAVDFPFREVTGGAENLQRSRLRGCASD